MLRLQSITDAQIEAEILTSLAHREANASSCPSEIARILAPPEGQAWRQLMPRIRAVATRLAHTEQVLITRGTVILSPDNLRGGPIRLRRGRRFDPTNRR